jgi:hypothetical protein
VELNAPLSPIEGVARLLSKTAKGENSMLQANAKDAQLKKKRNKSHATSLKDDKNVKIEGKGEKKGLEEGRTNGMDGCG